ncbi:MULTISPECIES: FkbM family methyltransferase [unclassified Pseudoalteromonas]|uniref:FkbM family methyltransferase n=1 Tax=unclassified Pseudoalteromonas TaxID=194690 RepID=UPI0020981CF5|nr:FkbM family methyltransferase [Pseudoalteromonas sp. XMcav2-N]MCO7189413.1 FkbM family methyltransferase [Pseudoalteromonas sp. XMcav2-N]
MKINKHALRPNHCPDLIRMGNHFDGGYIVPKSHIEETDVLLSLGINDDWRFDKEFQALNPDCRVVGVDYTVGLGFIVRKTLQNSLKSLINTLLFRHDKRQKYWTRLLNCVFFYSFFRGKNCHLQRRVSKASDQLDISLDELINQHCGAKDDIIFLKMDIEGAEYQVIDDLCKHADRINVVAAEFHHLDTQTADFNHFIELIKAHFHVVHIHGNNYGKYADSIDFPETVEITFINKALAPDATVSQLSYPVEGLDFPNNPKKPDYSLAFE